jgi:signal transduction histidine kinase
MRGVRAAVKATLKVSEMNGANDFLADVARISGIASVSTILDVVCRITGMGFAAVARVTEDRWIACSVKDDIAFGLEPGDELKVESTICHEIRQTREPVIINHVAEDAAFCTHHTPKMYGFQSYISMPIILPAGEFFGTLCAIDPRPARLNSPEIIGMFKLFAELIAYHLDAQSKLETSEASLGDERRTAELREQFIAVLGHDLRNPLASIEAGARLLVKTPLNERALSIIAMIQTSVSRMGGLIDNVLDFARGRLGNGLTLTRKPNDMTPVFQQIVGELQITHPERVIETDFRLDQPINCDRSRLSQLLSNLLANALTHGASDGPIGVGATTDRGYFVLSVSNSGDPIPPQTLERFFEPFERGATQQSKQGLGLGLYIAAQIAQAHGGRLSASSALDETCFTFRMPLH